MGEVSFKIRVWGGAGLILGSESKTPLFTSYYCAVAWLTNDFSSQPIIFQLST